MPSEAYIFEKETDLTHHILGLLPKYLKDTAQYSHFSVDIEVSVGRTIADIVAIMWNGSLISSPPLSAYDSVILSILRQ